MYRVIVAGGRGFNDYQKLERHLNCFFSEWQSPDYSIVSGAANGADKLGERYAKENNYQLTRFPAQWKKYGRSAGYRRNEVMAVNADALVAFWDGQSRGTKHMIDTAKSKGLNVKIILGRYI